MLFTRECDYSVRILRVLSAGDVVNVQEIARREDISVSIAYKITRKLEKAGYIESFRGVNGGYAMKKPLKEITLYDLFQVVDRKLLITECMNHDFVCSQNSDIKPCLMHSEFLRIQDIVSQELKAKTLSEIFGAGNKK